MEIIWTANAKKDLFDFLQSSKLSSNSKIISYINSLTNYVEILSTYSSLGKILFHINDLEIRQLIYKKHRILYFINSNQIIILSVIHVSRDINHIINFLKNYFK